eukprot:515596_1
MDDGLSPSEQTFATVDQVKYEDCDIKKCKHLHEMRMIMNQYIQVNNEIQHQNILDISQKALEHYLHLMEKHDKDEHFEYIVNQFEKCDIMQCKLFRRNYRDRNARNKYHLPCVVGTDNLDFEDRIHYVVYSQILDKIHCNFAHCYDIGNRLYIKEREQLQNQDHKNDMNNLCDMRKILSPRHNIYQQITDCKVTRNLKYNQLFTADCNENKEEEKLQSNDKPKDFKMYNLGQEFMYGYNMEISDGRVYLHKSLMDRMIFLSRKYNNCLKSNKIAIISLEQYMAEYKKAELHYNSQFKQSKSLKRREKHEIGENWYGLRLHHILSLMIYCNYDALQNAFSKTYRLNDNGKQHEEFYWLGRYLKQSVHRYGTKTNHGHIHNFYHGMGEKLLFPQYIGNNGDASIYNYAYGIKISCPLSTSSEFEVSVNFTNHNRGLIIQFFSHSQEYKDMFLPPARHMAKYFSVSWLSDFANEKEYLFVQNKHPLQIKTIIEPYNGCDYQLILKALTAIDDILLNCHISGSYEHIDESVSALAMMLLQHQLSSKIQQYKALKSLNKLGSQMVDTFCQKRETIQIQYHCFKKYFGSFVDLLFHSQFEWFNLELMNVLLPNIECIIVDDITVCTGMFQYIFAHLCVRNVIKRIIIWNPNGYSNELLAEYQKKFERIEYCMEKKGDDSLILLSIKSKDYEEYNFTVGDVHSSADSEYYIDETDENDTDENNTDYTSNTSTVSEHEEKSCKEKRVKYVHSDTSAMYELIDHGNDVDKEGGSDDDDDDNDNDCCWCFVIGCISCVGLCLYVMCCCFFCSIFGDGKLQQCEHIKDDDEDDDNGANPPNCDDEHSV